MKKVIENKNPSHRELLGMLKYLENLKVAEPSSDIMKKLQVGPEVLYGALDLLTSFSFPITIDQGMVSPSPFKNDVKLTLTISEWFLVKGLIDERKDEVDLLGFKDFLNKIKEKEQSLLDDQKSIFQLGDLNDLEFQRSEKLRETETHEVQIMEAIDTAILDHRLMKIKLSTGDHYEALALKLAYLDQDLSVIAEEKGTASLITIKIKDITDLELTKDEREPFTDVLQVSCFISGIRKINNSDVRLILKINSLEDVNLNPPYQYLDRPFIIVNNDGELIWSATLEKNKALFDWIGEIREHVEFLSPEDLLSEVDQYLIGAKSAS